MNLVFTPQQRLNKYIAQRNVARKERDLARDERNCLQDDVNLMQKNETLREQFVATLSHDLRNPISAIKMAMEVMQLESDLSEFDDLFDLINRNANMAEDLISRLLDATLIKSGARLPIHRVECDIIPILKRCRETQVLYNKEKIDFTEIHEKNIRGFWDPEALERVFNNLFSNALKFSYKGKKVIVKVWQDSNITNISFNNYGKVISLEDQPQIFNSYFRVKDEKPQGWGLGLTLVRGIVESHDGKVDLFSSQTEGTTFTVRIPTIPKKTIVLS